MYNALKKEGFMTLLLMRLIPVVPYNILNYAADWPGEPAAGIHPYPHRRRVAGRPGANSRLFAEKV